MRKGNSFDSIWDLIKRNVASLDSPRLTTPRKRRKPVNYLGEQKTPQYNDITEAKLMHKRVYFNAVCTIIACIKERFDKSGFKACQRLEKLLIDATDSTQPKLVSLLLTLNIFHTIALVFLLLTLNM